MLEDFKIQTYEFLSSIGRFFWKKTIGQAAAIIGVITLLQALGIWELLYSWIINTFASIFALFQSPYFGIPTYYWLIALVWFLVVTIWAIRQYLYLRVVSGVFFDNFKHGLQKWDFDREEWKIEEEDGRPILSVSESSDGGITKKGFNWSDYEFSFETKVINECSGWIIKAENRNKYFMTQLNLTDPQNPRLRPHLRFNDLDYPWVALEGSAVSLNHLNLKQPIRLLEWMKVRIIVHSNEIEVYINGDHVMHFYMPDPFRLDKGEKIFVDKNKEIKTTKDIIILSYPIGRVGFRCSGPGEHAHFRQVKVKPLI